MHSINNAKSGETLKNITVKNIYIDQNYILETNVNFLTEIYFLVDLTPFKTCLLILIKFPLIQTSKYRDE